MAKLADAIALGAIGETLGGSNPLPPMKLLKMFMIKEGVTGAGYFFLFSGDARGETMGFPMGSERRN